jgi:hypothetical protein
MKPNPLRDFGIGFALASFSWACWAWRTAACVAGSAWLCGACAAVEEAVTMGAVLYVVRLNTVSGLAGCCLGAAAGATLATMYR